MIQGKKLVQPYTVLKEKEEKRFEDFFLRFSRNGATILFSEFMMFAIDRSIIHNKIGFSTLQMYFEDAFKQSIPQDKIIKVDERAPLPGQFVEKGIQRHQFNLLLGQLSYYIYHSDKNHLDKLLNEILTEKTVVSKDSSVESVRILIYDEINKRILNEQCIKMLCQFETELKNIYTIYMQENLEQQDIMLSWKEISVQNKKLNAQALVRFLRDAEIVPHLLSIEQFEEIMMKVLPPANNREHDFYSKSQIVKLYEKELILTHKIDGDPLLLFHELQLLMARLAFELCLKDDIKDSKRDPERIKKFFQELLHLRVNEDVGIKPLPQLNKKLFQNIERFQGILLNPLNYEDEDRTQKAQELKEVNLIELAAQQQQEQLFDKAQIELPLDQIIKLLEKELPAVPPLPEQNKLMEKWDPEDRITIGNPPPAPPQDKSKQKAASKPKQKARLKPGEAEPRKIIYEEGAKQPAKTSEEYHQELVDKLNFEQKLLSSVERGTMSEIQVIPVLIPEILYPPNPPKQIRSLIEAGICAHNEGNFLFALKNYEEARILETKEQIEAFELFLEFQRASVYESAGRDDLALQSFIYVRNQGNKIPMNNPDRALAYCGLGLVLYNTEEWEYALRSFLMARQIRERLLGIESVDTATVFNNLGCCMYMLERNQEAYAYFRLSHAVLEQFLGPYHTRTMTAARNLMKSNKNYFDNQPAYKKLWVTYLPDQFGTKKSVKKAKKGKGKK